MIRGVETDGLMAEVQVDRGGGQVVTTVITAGSVDRLGLAEGDDVSAEVTATEAMIER